MTASAVDSSLPDMARSDAGVSTFSEWTIGSPERQRAAFAAAIDAWEDLTRPDGLVSYTCFLSTDGSTLRHHTQWTDDAARSRFCSAETPEAASERLADRQVAWLRSIDEIVPGIERSGSAVYDLYCSHVPADPAPDTGCVVIVTVDFDAPDRDRQAQWIDAVVAALHAEPDPIPGLNAAHFHRSLDGSRVINYAEWTSEQAHVDALESGPNGLAQTDMPEWSRVFDFPGISGPTDIKRYREHRSLAAKPVESLSPSVDRR